MDAGEPAAFKLLPRTARSRADSIEPLLNKDHEHSL
jgi:hypothetical protein